MGKFRKRQWAPPQRKPPGDPKYDGSPSQGKLPKGRRRMLQLPQGESGPVTRYFVDPESMR